MRDKLVAREVCTDWMNYVNNTGVCDEVDVWIRSDDVMTCLASRFPVFTRFHLHKIDLTRQSVDFWTSYSDTITSLNFYDCAVIPRRTSDCSTAVSGE